MVKYLIIFVFLFALLQFNCAKQNKSIIAPRDISEIIFSRYNKSEINNFIKQLTQDIEEGDSTLYLVRGFYYTLLRNDDKALSDFLISLKIDSTNSDAYLGIGLLFHGKAQDSLAKYLDKAIKFNPKNAFAYFYHSSIQKSNKAALLDYNKAIELKPEYAMFYSWRGVFYEDIDSIDLAIKDFKKSIELDDSISLNYAMLGIINQIKKKNYHEALKNYSLEIKTETYKSNGYESRGEIYYELKLYKKSIDDYKNALRFLTKSNTIYSEADFYYNISRNYSLLKNDSAYLYLKLTFDEDPHYVNSVIKEKDFDNIKGTKEFKEIINKYKN